MIDLNFDFKTVGGVANIYVIPPSAFGGITTNYATKRHSIQVTSFTPVIRIPRYADETFSFGESHGRDEHGDYWEPIVQGVIPKASLDNADIIETLERGEWIVLTQDHNGAVRVCGDADTPLFFSTDAGSGSAYTDRNQTAFTISGRLGHPSYVLDYEL